MSDKKELAEVVQATLDDKALQAWLEELTTLAQIDAINTKGDELSRSEKTPLTLPEAVEALRAGKVRGVQVRYRLLEEVWLDTLMGGAA